EEDLILYFKQEENGIYAIRGRINYMEKYVELEDMEISVLELQKNEIQGNSETNETTGSFILSPTTMLISMGSLALILLLLYIIKKGKKTRERTSYWKISFENSRGNNYE
ncbi:MAG: hypothetical protein ABEK17_04320, partial [Candidatus Aenigmatarchaeota archaeon]